MSRVGSIFNLGILVVSLAGLALIPSQAASPKKTASGYVYLDREQTGHRNSDDPGIQGVAVSNQRTVVLTDENGYYNIPLEAEDIIFISKPDGYDFHLNEYFLPQFYYIHSPEGSPTLDYPGIQPTGELPEAINFGLRNRIQEERMQVTVIGDPQPRNRQELDYFRAGILNEVAGFDNDYLFVLGDMMYDDLSLFQAYNQMMASLQTPVINVIGNHDLNLDAPDNRHARETFKSYYGPTYYSFSEAGKHFVVLDNIDYRGRDEHGNPRYIGKISERQLKWLRSDLERIADNTQIVILTHIPLHEPNRPNNPALNTKNVQQLMEILDRFNKVLIMAAHVHTISHSYLGLEFGRANPNTAHQILVAAASGSWWTGPKDEYGIPSATQRDGSPKGIHHLTFYENSYHERFKAAGLSKSHQIRIEDPSGFKGHSDSTLTHLVVNVFNGSERSTVEARINHEEWKSLANKSNGYSPHFKRLKQNEQTGDWIHPIPTNHIWELELPEDLKPGFHLLEVRTTDQYGKAYSESKVFEFIQAD